MSLAQVNIQIRFINDLYNVHFFQIYLFLVINDQKSFENVCKLFHSVMQSKLIYPKEKFEKITPDKSGFTV